MRLENGDVERGGAAREDPNQTREDLQNWGERSSSLPEQQGHTAASSPTPS